MTVRTGTARRRLRAAGRRLALSVLVLWGAVTVAFLALHLAKGKVIDLILGSSSGVTPEVRQQIIKDYGLDRPLPVQYLTYLEHVLRGDLGTSYQLQIPVSTAIGDALPSTLELAFTSLAISAVVSVVVAVLTAHRRPWIRGTFSAVETVGVAVPTFWFGILLLTVFAFSLHLAPAAGGLVLPAIALSVLSTGMLTQVLRDGLENALDEPFVVTARARGLGDLAVRLRHGLRHALLPAITLAGWLLGITIGSSVVVEQVFSRPGLGRLALSAVTGKDMPVVMGVVLVVALVYVIVSTLLDILYNLIDPRLRTEAAS
jgi:peptide/nickel transport system permease protein